MEKSCLTEIKAILKSLVLSSTEKMTVEQLNRDYRDTEGEPIPFRKLGYETIEKFLHAIPDTLRVFGSGPTAIVCFVANEKSDHIHDMIMQQKKPKGRIRSRNRSRIRSRSSTNNKFDNNGQPVNNTPGYQLSPFQNVNRRQAVRTVKLWNGPPPTASFALPKASVGAQLNVKSQEENTLKKYEQHVEQVSKLLKNNCFITQSPPPPLPLSKTIKNSSESKIAQSVGEAKAEIDSKKFSKEPKTAASSASVNVSNLLKDIKAPKAKEKPQPIKQPSDTEKVLKIRRNAKFLYPIEENSSTDYKFEKLENNTCEVSELKLKKDANKLFDVTDEEEEEEEKDKAVPSFAMKHNVFCLDFPEYTVPFGYKIAPYEIPKDIKVDSCIKVFISEIHSPFRFWFHLYKEEHELDELMFQIERYYNRLDADEFCIPLTSLIPGQVCSACFNGLWHRAEIVAPPVNDTIKVFFMDYGTVDEVSVENIKFLDKMFAQLPAQAFRGCLSHIKPRQLHWSHEATIHFLNLTSDQMLYAKITEIDTQNKILYMILCNTNNEQIIQINTSLVEHRYASFNEAWKYEIIQTKNGIRLHHPREDFPT